MTDDAPRPRLDDLRRFAAALAAGAGLAPARAAALASHLLWFDAAGAHDFGIATLPTWLGRIERGEVDPKAEATVTAERAGTAVLDARGGLGPLILARAAALAVEKAREMGVGLVRVTGLGAAGPAAPAAAEMAVGPMVGLILGPGPSWALAVPSAEGPPLLVDTALAGPEAAPAGPLTPWAALVPEGDWLVQAVAVAALESLSALRERVASVREAAPGRLLPAPWEARRREARERGVPVAATTWDALRQRAGRLGIEVPAGPG